MSSKESSGTRLKARIEEEEGRRIVKRIGKRERVEQEEKV